jgi:hypothetical protein
MIDDDGNNFCSGTLKCYCCLRFLCIRIDREKTLLTDRRPFIPFAEQSIFRANWIIELPQRRNIPETNGKIMTLTGGDIERMAIVESKDNIEIIVGPEHARLAGDHRRIQHIVAFHSRCENNVKQSIITRRNQTKQYRQVRFEADKRTEHRKLTYWFAWNKVRLEHDYRREPNRLEEHLSLSTVGQVSRLDHLDGNIA